LAQETHRRVHSLCDTLGIGDPFAYAPSVSEPFMPN